MQTIPELNTNYSPSVQFDLRNSLLKGKQLQQADLVNSLLRTRIESRPETMRIQREQADADLTKTNMEIAKTRFGMVRDALATVDVDNLGEEDYPKMRDWAIKTVKADPSYLPAIDRFYKPDISGTKKVFDKDKFKAWRQNAISTSDTIMKDIPKEGATHTFAVDTPDGVKDKTIQFRNGKWEELGMGGKFAPKEKKEPKQSRITLYNIKNPNKTRTVWVEEGVDYADPEGWTQKTPWKPEKAERPRETDAEKLAFQGKLMKLKDSFKLGEPETQADRTSRITIGNKILNTIKDPETSDDEQSLLFKQWYEVNPKSVTVPYLKDGKTRQFALPKIKGVQVTAQDVLEVANSMGLTITQTLRTKGLMK